MGGCLARIEKSRGGRLLGTWALMLTRPKIGGWALSREWTLTRDNYHTPQKSASMGKPRITTAVIKTCILCVCHVKKVSAL